MSAKESNNTIFNLSGKPISVETPSRISSLDANKMNADEERYFNTYRYWKPFAMQLQNVVNGTDQNSDGSDTKGEPGVDAVVVEGTKSLFNNYNGVFTDEQYRENANMPLLDSPSSRRRQRENSKCTIKDLVEASAAGLMGRQIYNYSDFAYCKYLGKMSNNYLITLRRFGTPCGDRIDLRTYDKILDKDKNLQQHLPDIGRLITWIGTPGNEMSNILKYTYGMQWADQEAKIDDVDSSGEGGPLASIFNMSNSNYRRNVQRGLAGSNFAGNAYMTAMVGGQANFEKHPYKPETWNKMYDTTKIYGPVDVIDRTKKRKRGLAFEQKFQLTFDYELRSYYGVNGKAAMMDLLANILATTYTHGTFWGGERRWVGAAQDNIFANLPIFKLADNGQLNDPGAVLDAFIASIHEGAKAFNQGFKGETTKEKIKNAIKDIGGMLLGGILNKLGRPQKHALASLVSGAPVGCWHLTVGNPKSPILEIGNLICTGSEIEHYGPLGLDDFPTGLRVKISLEHGKPRDLAGIEQMYGRGDTRIYSPLGAHVLDMYHNAVSIDSSAGYKKTEAPAIPPEQNEKMQESFNKKFNAMKSETDPADYADANINAEKAQDTSNIKDTTPEELYSLMRYFGTQESKMIIAASSEALYGNEKHKNDHVKGGSSNKSSS